MSKPTGAQIPSFGLDQRRFHAAAAPGVTAARDPVYGLDQAVAHERPWMLVLSDAPVISGTTQVEETLTVTPASWPDGTVVSRQWLRDGAPIGGATGTTYELVEDDEDAMISVREDGESLLGTKSVISAAVGPIEAAETEN